MSVELIVGLVAVILAVLKTIDYFARRKIDTRITDALKEVSTRLEKLQEESQESSLIRKEIVKILDNISKRGENIEDTVIRTLDMHEKFDSNGTPIWYVPRTWAETQKEIVNVCHEISMTQKMIANTLERIEGQTRDKRGD